MQIVLIRPPVLDPARSSTWGWYGATQVLRMMGLSYAETDVADEATLVIDPAREQVCLRCRPEAGLEDIPARDLLQARYSAVFTRASSPPPALPLFGPVRAQPATACTRALITADGGDTAGELVTQETVGHQNRRLQFNGRLFATLGLYLSRFSWAGNTSFKGFVREVDDLWEHDLRQRYGAVAVVDRYAALLLGLLSDLLRETGLPFAAAWPHPSRDGRVMQHGVIISHDVDQLFPDPQYRGTLDQTGNNRFCLPQWRELEQRLDVRSAYYFYSPRPGDRYWFEPNYSPADPAVAQEIKRLHEGGWEVSLHQMSDADPNLVAGESIFFAETTGYRPVGTRSHYLKHSPDTLSYKAAAGLRYDSTWYAEQTQSSFLCGTTLPYRPLDCRTGEPVGLWEFPFVIEDGIVFGVYGQGTARDVAGAAEDGCGALEEVLASGGYACLNWHNYTFSDMSHTGPADSWPPAMELIVAALRERSPALWTPLPSELADWCTRRESITIEYEPDDRVIVRNTGAAACPDFVLCWPAGGGGAGEAEGAVAVERGDGQKWLAVPVPLEAGETREVRVGGG